MAQYINNTTLFDTYGSNITYNFDYVAFTEDTLTQTTVSINNATELSDTTNTITYDIIKHYINKLDLTKINTVNLKITNTYTESLDYLLTDLYITNTNDTSIGIINEEYSDLASEAGVTNNIIYKYYTILKFSPLNKNVLNTANNVFIITPLHYTNTNVNTVSKSTNVVLSVKSLMENLNTSITTDYAISELNSPEIIINNVNSINELIKSDSDYYFIDSNDKIIMFTNPLYIGIKSDQPLTDTNTITPQPEIFIISDATEYVNTDENVNMGKTAITKNNSIGQSSTDLDDKIYINCHPIDDGGRIIPKSDNSKKTNRDIKISIIFFGVLFTVGLLVYIYMNRTNELFLLFDSTNLTNELNGIRIKYGIMLFVFITSWVFIGINIDNLPD